MGRALKIQKTNIGSGSTVTGSNPEVTTYNQNVLTDAGYPNFGSLTSPATPYNSADTLNSNQFLGVVGGSPTTSTASATFPEILAQVNISLADGSSTSAGNGRIIRQKGAHKFLVAYTASATADESFIVGQAYQISTLGTTNWQACGAGADAAVGDIFTAVAVGSGTGEGYPVGVCVLSNTGSPTAGNMSIEYSVGDSSAVYASYITNKWIRDWNGMTYGNRLGGSAVDAPFLYFGARARRLAGRRNRSVLGADFAADSLHPFPSRHLFDHRFKAAYIDRRQWIGHKVAHRNGGHLRLRVSASHHVGINNWAPEMGGSHQGLDRIPTADLERHDAAEAIASVPFHQIDCTGDGAAVGQALLADQGRTHVGDCRDPFIVGKIGRRHELYAIALLIEGSHIQKAEVGAAPASRA